MSNSGVQNNLSFQETEGVDRSVQNIVRVFRREPATAGVSKKQGVSSSVHE